MIKVIWTHFQALLLACAVAPAAAYAHGEDKPGPHGGVIRMPGALHTEVVALDPGRIGVYLLDMHFEEPTVDGSSVRAALVRDGKEHELNCCAEETRFICEVPSATSLEQGDLRIEAARKGVKGGPAVYPLPLR